MRRWKGNFSLLRTTVLMPVGFGLLAWFAIAPALDYAGSMIWVFSALMLAIATVDLHQSSSQALGVGVIVLSGLMVADLRPARIEATSVLPAPRPLTIPAFTASGLELFVAATKGCGDAPLVCTDFLDPMLRLVEPHRIEQGFTLTPLRGQRAPQNWAPSSLTYVNYPWVKSTWGTQR